VPKIILNATIECEKKINESSFSMEAIFSMRVIFQWK
jgi:hypothetical protein